MSETKSTPDKILRLSSIALVATVWSSTILFGIYIICFYFIALLVGNMEQWNELLPGLYDTKTQKATIGIGIHFAAGGIILILGCIQLVERIRTRFPMFHRIVGRIYILASFLAAIGGLFFIFFKGTIGGLTMDIGFGLYGILMFGAAFQTLRHAMARRLDQHRAWAIRLFALAIGSWLYRMDYGFWFLFTDGLGHTREFSGWFDYFMAFWFYLPNLLVAEVIIGKVDWFRNAVAKTLASFGLILATTFLLLATYYFTIKLWGPAILEVVGM